MSDRYRFPRGRAEVIRWASEHLEELRELEPAFVAGLDDRAFEAWEPLLAIAELAELEGGAGWTENVRRAAVILTGARPADADGDRVAALTAIRRMFDVAGVNTLGSEAIVAALNSDDELPFGDWRKGVGIDARGLARLLRPFRIAPHNVRAGGVQCNGYHRERFVDLWARYCKPLEELREAPFNAFSPQEGRPDPSHRPDPNNQGGVGHSDDPSPDPQWDGSEHAEILRERGVLDAGTDQNGPPGTDTRHGDDCSRVVAVGQDARHRTPRWLIAVEFDGRGSGSGGRCSAHIADYARTRARDGSEPQHSRAPRTPAAEGAP